MSLYLHLSRCRCFRYARNIGRYSHDTRCVTVAPSLSRLVHFVVYALYNRRTSLAIFFILLLVSKLGAASLAAYRGFPHQRFNHSCLVITGSQPALYLFACVPCLTNSVLPASFIPQGGRTSRPVRRPCVYAVSTSLGCTRWMEYPPGQSSESPRINGVRSDQWCVHSIICVYPCLK